MHNFAPSICGQTYLYGSNADSSVSSRIVAALTMHIERQILCQALSESMQRFPYMAVSSQLDDERIVFVPAEGAVPVFEVGEDIPQEFSDPRMNGWLIRVTFFHKHLYVDFHRSIADEFGMITFVKALILRYVELSGYQVNNDGSVKLLSSQPFEGEREDAMIRMENMHSSRPVWYMDAKAVVPEKVMGLPEQVVQVRIPQNKLKRDYKDLPTVPVTYVAPFISHAVHEILENEMSQGEYVVAAVHVNLRPYFPSASLLPYSTTVLLAYNRNLNEYPYNIVLMSQKKLLEAQLKNDTLAYSAQRKISDIEKTLENSACLNDLNTSFSALQENRNSCSTYDICRIGNLILPESLQRLVSELYPVIPSSGKMVSVTVSSYKGELSVTISGRRHSDTVARRLVELLKDNDIDAYIADRYDFCPL